MWRDAVDLHPGIRHRRAPGVDDATVHTQTGPQLDLDPCLVTGTDRDLAQSGDESRRPDQGPIRSRGHTGHDESPARVGDSPLGRQPTQHSGVATRPELAPGPLADPDQRTGDGLSTGGSNVTGQRARRLAEGQLARPTAGFGGHLPQR